MDDRGTLATDLVLSGSLRADVSALLLQLDRIRASFMAANLLAKGTTFLALEYGDWLFAAVSFDSDCRKCLWSVDRSLHCAIRSNPGSQMLLVSVLASWGSSLDGACSKQSNHDCNAIVPRRRPRECGLPHHCQRVARYCASLFGDGGWISKLRGQLRRNPCPCCYWLRCQSFWLARCLLDTRIGLRCRVPGLRLFWAVPEIVGLNWICSTPRKGHRHAGNLLPERAQRPTFCA